MTRHLQTIVLTIGSGLISAGILALIGTSPWIWIGAGVAITALVFVRREWVKRHKTSVLKWFAATIALILLVWFGWPWPRVQEWISSDAGDYYSKFKCSQYIVTFVELEIERYVNTDSEAVRLQFSAYSESQQFEFKTISVDGKGTYPLGVTFGRVPIHDQGIYLDMRALDPNSNAPTGWTWPIFKIAGDNPDAWGTEIREVSLRNDVIAYTLRFKIACGD